MIKDIKVQNENVQATDRVMAKLHADFPQCFTNEGKFDLEKFKSLLNDKIDITEEGYDLNFLGKNYANLIASTETETVLQPDLEHNSKPENKNSQNIYISGDNLDALKHLLKSYAGKIKCIYIDPPYNTGSDGFVYNDKFNYTPEQLQTKLGIGEEKAKRILDLCTRGSASHSAWLMFMAPRLMLARDLLTEDGVIFISIDDNEQANLKLLCDGVFGEENCVACAPRKTGAGSAATRSDSELRKLNDFVLIYKKSENLILQKIVVGQKEYNLTDEFGKYMLGQFQATGSDATKRARPNMWYPIYVLGDNSLTSIEPLSYKFKIYPNKINGEDGRWLWQSAKFESDNKKYIYFDGNKLYRKIYYNENEDQTIYQVEKAYIDAPQYNNAKGTIEVNEIFGSKGIFSNPKPSQLIEWLINLIDSKNSLIVDFFSGSASSAQAVLQLNAVDGGNRNFIMVQLPETTKVDAAKNAGYETIDQIGQERIRRAAAKIKSDIQTEISQKESQLKAKEEKLAKENRQGNMFNEENPLEQEIETLKQEIETKKNTLQNMDWGFKHYTLQDVPQDTLDKMETFDPSMSNAFANPDILESFGAETVLATWMVKDGYGLTQNAEPLQLADYTAYHCGGHIYMIEGESFDEKAMIALVDKYGQEADFNPHNVVLFGYSFTFTQTEMIKKNLSAVKKLNESINIDIRY